MQTQLQMLETRKGYSRWCVYKHESDLSSTSPENDRHVSFPVAQPATLSGLMSEVDQVNASGSAHALKRGSKIACLGGVPMPEIGV